MKRFSSKKQFLIIISLFVMVTTVVTPLLKGLYDLVFAADTLVSAVYQDSNNDGAVDRIQWVLDENVTACNYEAGDWTIDAAGDMNISAITGISCTGLDSILNIDVSADPFITGAFSDPVLSYTNQGNADDITLTSGPMTDKLGVTAIDNAAPFLINDPTNPQYFDTDGDGTIDLTYLYFTEFVSYSYNDADWSTVANTLTSFDVFGCLACTGDSTLQLFAVAAAGITGVSGGTEPTISYTGGNLITDSLGNSALAFGPVSLYDNAAPTLFSAVYLDTDLDGTVDTVRTTWSENVTMSGSTLDDWGFAPGDFNLTFDSAPDDLLEGLTLDLLVTADANETGSVDPVLVAYNNDDTNDSVHNSPLPAGTTLAIGVSDGASPQVLTWSLDMIEETLTLNFTETVNASTLDATVLTIQDAATATESVPLTGGTTASVDGSEIVVGLSGADVLSLQGNTSVGTTTANSFLILTTALIDDMIGNSVVAIADGDALQAAVVTLPAVPAGGTQRSERIASGGEESADGATGGSSYPSAETSGQTSDGVPPEGSESETDQEKDLISDIVGDPEEVAFLRLMEMGVVQGNPDGSFAPQAALKRAAAIKMIGLLSEIIPDRARGGDTWYSAFERAMKRAGIINGGIDPDTFELRANFLAFIMKAQGLNIDSLPACEAQAFKDVLTSKWYCPVVEHARNNGWIRETTGMFNPSDVATRSWAIGVLDRAFPEESQE